MCFRKKIKLGGKKGGSLFRVCAWTVKKKTKSELGEKTRGGRSQYGYSCGEASSNPNPEKKKRTVCFQATFGLRLFRRISASHIGVYVFGE